MFKRAGSYIFFMAVYLSGILIGEIYTPSVISYAKQINALKNVEPLQIQQKPQQLKKQKTIIQTTVWANTNIS